MGERAQEVSTVEKVAIVGSRAYSNPGEVAEYVMGLPADTLVVSGAAPGVDSWALHVADAIGLPWRAFPAAWHVYGRRAGMIRNRLIIAEADRVVAFWDGISKGTLNSMDLARAAGKRLEVRSGRSTPTRGGGPNG